MDETNTNWLCVLNISETRNVLLTDASNKPLLEFLAAYLPHKAENLQLAGVRSILGTLI